MIQNATYIATIIKIIYTTTRNLSYLQDRKTIYKNPIYKLVDRKPIYKYPIIDNDRQ